MARLWMCRMIANTSTRSGWRVCTAQGEPVESTYRQAKKHELGTAVEVELTLEVSLRRVEGTGGKDSKLCAILGYKYGQSGLPYADLAAFKELKLHPDPKAAEKERAKGGGGKGGGGDEGEEGGHCDCRRRVERVLTGRR